MPDDILKKNRLYVTIQVDEDLPYIVRHTGIDNLLVGSDYTHADASMELEFTKRLQERVDQGDLPEGAVQKIVYDNPKAFYAL
jgi:microsomal dipeptidase-like Zn-dependent dipeptidase